MALQGVRTFGKNFVCRSRQRPCPTRTREFRQLCRNLPHREMRSENAIINRPSNIGDALKRYDSDMIGEEAERTDEHGATGGPSARRRLLILCLLIVVISGAAAWY